MIRFVLIFLFLFPINAEANRIDVVGGGGGGSGSVSDAVYGAAWDGDTTVAPSKNAVYDKMETIATGGDSVLIDGTNVADASGVDLIGGTTGIDITFNAAASPDTATFGIDLTELTCGAGLACASSTSIATDSTEASFLASGALVCGAGTAGKMQVHTTPLQYCDNSATPTLRYAAYGNSTGIATSAASDDAWTTHNSYPAACSSGQATTAIGDTLTCATFWDALGDISLTSANILVGNGSNVAAAVAMSGDIAIDNLGATTIQANSVALTTDTTGNYAAGDAEAGAALTGDSATAFFSTGQIEAARGGTAIDSSASTGFPEIVSGTWAINANTKILGFVITNGNTAIDDTVTDPVVCQRLEMAYTVTGWYIYADQSGSITLDVWKDVWANHPPTNADSIAGTEKPTLSSAVTNSDTSLSSMTTAWAAGDVICIEIESSATITKAWVNFVGNPS